MRKGKPYEYPHCNECQKQYRRDHYNNNKQPYLDRAKERNNRIKRSTRVHLVGYLKSHPCVDCGESDIRILQFDHREPTTKKATISFMVSHAYSWKTVLSEIEKCEVRCGNCHTKRTIVQFGWWMDKLEVIEDDDGENIGM